MKTLFHQRWLIAGLIIGLSGCASQTLMTEEQVLQQYPQLSALNSAYSQVGQDNGELLAPENYAKAGDMLKRATNAARASNREAATLATTTGLGLVDTIKRDSQTSRMLLADVLLNRERAYEAGAKSQESEKLRELDRQLRTTTALVEAGEMEQAKRRRPQLLAGYAQLELIALKQGTIDQAQSAITAAKQHGAPKYAPQTLALAEEQMTLALSILDADRSQTEKANLHASNARWQAQQSSAITETIKDFNRRDYRLEDVVLWHQQQLTTINAPFGHALPFNRSNDEVVTGLSKAVNDLFSERDQVRSQLKDAEQQTAVAMEGYQQQLQQVEQQKVSQKSAYETQIRTTEQQHQTLNQQERADQQRFETVQAMFNPQEARVYRQRKNVLISVHGFDYPSGQSEIQAANFPLMNKVVRAVNTFPQASVEVNGHTDATGSDVNNQMLSQARAEKVSQFLMEVGGVAQTKMKAAGFGETRPVASNDTHEGRAENRRVEVLIINDQ